MRVPAHGRGRLLAGGRPGNAGGSGAPPSARRAAMRHALAERVGIAAAIADDPRGRPADRVRALDFPARYGMGEQRGVNIEEVTERLRQTIGVIRDQLPPADAERLIGRLEEVWDR